MVGTTIQAEDWPEPLEASPDVIRALLWSFSFAEFQRFKIVRQDGWELWGLGGKDGWNLRTGTVQPRRSLTAVSAGSKYARRRLRSSLPWSLFNRFEHFDMDFVERVAAEFVDGASPPTLVSWVEMP